MYQLKKENFQKKNLYVKKKQRIISFAVQANFVNFFVDNQ